MGAYLSTSITNPSVVAVGGLLAGNLVATYPAAGHYYMIMEQYTRELALIPGSRAYLYQAVAGGSFVSSTVNYSVASPAAAGVEETRAVSLAQPNSDCYLYVHMKQIAAVITAGAFVVGTTYKILAIGTTDFTLVGATANTVGLVFVATGVGVGTGIVCATPDPDTDETVDTVDITILSTAPSTGIDLGEMMNLMITMMIVVMMMKMMSGMMTGIS